MEAMEWAVTVATAWEDTVDTEWAAIQVTTVMESNPDNNYTCIYYT